MLRQAGFSAIEVVLVVVVVVIAIAGGYLLWQKYYPTPLFVPANHSLTTPALTSISKVTPTPIVDKEINDDPLVEQYSQLEDEATSADGKWSLAVRTNGYDKDVVILIDQTGKGHAVISLPALAIIWGKLESTNWSPDDRFVYVYYYGSVIDRDLYVIRTDGKTFANGASFLDIDNHQQLLQITGQFLPRVLDNDFKWITPHTLQWLENELVEGHFTSKLVAIWKLNIDAMTLISEPSD